MNCWCTGFDTGQFLFEQQMWQEALPHLGCAFETSEILMTTRAIEASCAYELFTWSASLLADTYTKLGYVDQSGEIYGMAVRRLTHELSCHPEAQTNIGKHLEYLDKFGQHSGSAGHQVDLSTAGMHHTLPTSIH